MNIEKKQVVNPFIRNADLWGNAKWIWIYWYNFHHYQDTRMQFRRSFELETVPTSVPVCVTADARYTLYVNGEFVNHGPVRGYQSHWPFDRFDIAPYLRKGKNVIAVLGYQFGTSNYTYDHKSLSGFLLTGQAGPVDLDTGALWKIRRAPGYICGVAPNGRQYHWQEFFDCRTGDDGWKNIDYDDSAWSDAFEGKTPGCEPWPFFEERGIPLLTKDILTPAAELEPLRFIPTENWRENSNVGHIHQRETAYDPSGSGTARIFDFGSEFTGFINIECDCSSDGAVLDLLITEICHDGIPFLSEITQETTFAGARLILKKGHNSHEFSVPWGGRYMMFLIRENVEITIKPSVRDFIYPIKECGTVHTSSEKVNAVFEMCKRTQRHCMVDTFIDGPWREYAQWFGDALVESESGAVLSSDMGLLARGLRLVGDSQIASGLLYGVVPGCGHGCQLPDFSAFYFAALRSYYMHTNSLGLYYEVRNTVKGVLNYFDTQSEKDGLLHSDKRYWLFLDWCPDLQKTGVPTLYNQIVLFCVKELEALAAAAQDEEIESTCSKVAARLTDAISEKLYDHTNRSYYGGLNDDLTVSDDFMSPHCAAFGILTGMFPEDQQKHLEKSLLPLLRGDRKNVRALPSCYFIHYIFQAVKKLGQGREVFECITRWWNEMLDYGCMTTPEQWSDICVPEHSFCHAWSAHPLIHFRDILLGIRNEAPGWDEVSFDPVFIPGLKTEGIVPTPHGTIKVSWECDENGVHSEPVLELPDGIKLVSAR